MARLDFNFWGPVVVLDHNDVETLVTVVNTTGDLAGIATKVAGIIPGAQGVAGLTQILAIFLKASSAVLGVVDRGNGIYLTIPWPAIATGAVGFVVPTPR